MIQIVSNLDAFLGDNFERKIDRAERACFDRFLLILDALEQRSLFDSSLLDIGCANGFFAYFFALALCRQVTAVDDARGASAEYGEDAFLAPLRKAQQEYAVKHLEVVDAPIERYLALNPARTWDVVLCLSVLHHFYTGYGDNPEVGLMIEEDRQLLFAAIGRSTGSVLYLEIDHGRVPRNFLNEFKEIGHFKGARTIGSSASAVGETREIYELWK